VVSIALVQNPARARPAIRAEVLAYIRRLSGRDISSAAKITPSGTLTQYASYVDGRASRQKVARASPMQDERTTSVGAFTSASRSLRSNVAHGVAIPWSQGPISATFARAHAAWNRSA
jgi:hypothetical protein